MKTYRVKQYNKAHTETLQEVSTLEALHKVNLQEATYLELHEKYAALKLLDAQKIGQQLLHKKQIISEYRDKPGKGLPYILAETMNLRTGEMHNNMGEWVISPEQKLEIFESFFPVIYL